MSLSTYSDLQAAVIAWLHREGDTDFATKVPSFITLAESRANGHAKSRQMEARTNLTAISGNAYVSLPSDLLEMRRLMVTSSNPTVTLKYATPDAMSKDYATGQVGTPVVFTVVGQQAQLAPIPDAGYTLEITYIQKIPALSDSNTTNWLLTNYPDVYLYGTLIQSATYTQDFAQLQTLQTLYRDAVDNMNAIDWYTGTTMAVRAG